MADARRRELERSDDLQARARLLIERQRAGELAPPRARLAAWLGDEAARLALAEDARAPEGGDLRAWLAALEAAHGPELAVWAHAEAHVACAREAQLSARDLAPLEAVAATIRSLAARGELRAHAVAIHQEPYGARTPAEGGLRLGLTRLGIDPHRAPDDPDVQRALAEIQRLVVHDRPGTWRYGYSVHAVSGGWNHILFHAPGHRGVGEYAHPLAAAAGWSPPPGAVRCPEVLPIFDDLIAMPHDAPLGLAAARAALLRWALDQDSTRHASPSS